MCALPAYSSPARFPADYASARLNILKTLEQLPAECVHHEAHRHPQTGPDSSPLYCDWLVLSRTPRPSRLLVLISGTHGVEGYVGSAIQSHLLANCSEDWLEDNELAVIIIHALNPWGFAWNRRCDHQRIDLNRNFIDFSHGLPNNPVYSRIQPLLKTGSLDQFVSHCADPAVTRGQYQFPGGLFYGGQAPSWSRQLLQAQCHQPLFQSAARVAVIDLHSGLGPYGYGEVINDHPVDSPGFRWAQQWYGNNAMSAELGASVSAPKTGLLDYFWHKLIARRGCFVTLEFGTFSADRLLRQLCEEELYYQRCRAEGRERDLSDPTVVALRDFFYPAENSWQEMTIFRAHQVVDMAIRGLNQ